MMVWGDVVQTAITRWQAWGDVWLSPFFYILVVFVLAIVWQGVGHQRALLGARAYPAWRDVVVLLFLGVTAGFIVSGLASVIVLDIDPGIVRLIGVLTIVFACVRIQYSCIAYSVGWIGVAHVIAVVIPPSTEWPGGVYLFWQLLQNVHMPSLLIVVGIAHVIEAFLIAVIGRRWAMPTYVHGERTKRIGAYVLMLLCPLPLCIGVVPLPLLEGNGIIAAEAVRETVIIPVCIGFWSWMTSGVVAQRVMSTAGTVLLYACALLAMGGGSVWVAHWIEQGRVASVLPIAQWVLLLLVAFFCIGGHRWMERRLQQMRSPLLTHDGRGLRILAVHPGSVAMRLGLQPGEIVHKINGQKIVTVHDVYVARTHNPTTVRIDVIDHRGELRFVQQAVYEHDPVLLGIVYCPLEGEGMEQKFFHLFGLLRRYKKS